MSNYLSKLFDESAVGLASRGQLNRPLEPRLWENLRVRLQEVYRKATGESFAVVSVDLIPRRMAAHEREKKPLSIGEVREFVLDWLPSDSAGDDFKARLICRLDAVSSTQPASTALVEKGGSDD